MAPRNGISVKARGNGVGPVRRRGPRRAVAGAGVEPATYRFSGGRSYQLSYPAAAVLTGFEPAAPTLAGWRALQTAPQDLASCGTSVAHVVPWSHTGLCDLRTGPSGDSRVPRV